MPFYFRKECPLNSGYLKQLSLAPLLSPFEQQIGVNAIFKSKF
ncbi:hypothetical protein SS322685_3572 [Shigella sonnei 3226-85]|nr:hypothetical protein SS53G_0278 [Shigella sonnei 53G]EIQ39588.1 hypothetical protein SS322685_3572 [Shigella sonnei 3226-85]EIQ52393.1 hypothetical protein SS482266_2233 [Shigella sonnei 4822-66]